MDTDHEARSLCGCHACGGWDARERELASRRDKQDAQRCRAFRDYVGRELRPGEDLANRVHAPVAGQRLLEVWVRPDILDAEADRQGPDFDYAYTADEFFDRVMHENRLGAYREL